MNKKQLIEKVRKLNKLMSLSSWNNSTKEELQKLYNDAKELGVIK